jgi:CIC family chloride channel protein
MRPIIPANLLPGRTARQLGRMLAIFGCLGLVAGLAAALFVALVEVVGEYALHAVVGIDPLGHTGPEAAMLSWPTGTRWLVLLVPTLGGLASGWLCARFVPEAMGTGTGAVIDAYHRRAGAIRRRAPVAKAVASALTIGSGGSAGVEGPVGFIVAGTGSLLGRLFRLSAVERRVLLMAGFAAGIGAVFHAPMASSIFAAEVLYRDLDIEHEVLVPAIVSSTISYATFGAIRGWDPIWTVPDVGFYSLAELGPYLALAVVIAMGGYVFVKIHDLVEHHIGGARRIPLWLRPGLGGLGVGIVGLVIPSAMGVSYFIAQTAIEGQVGFVALLALAVAKMVTNSLTSGSGGSGGLFAPSLVIGAALGGAMAAATNYLLPDLGVQPAAFAVVGMAGFFAAVINAPLSTVIMVSELVGSYHLLVPTLWVCSLAWFMLRKSSLYKEQVASRLEAPGHVADMMGAVLRRMTVSQATEPEEASTVTVPASLGLRELVRLFSGTAQGVFPIVADDGKLVGVVDGREVRRTIGEAGIDGMLIARDFQVPAVTATPDESLYAVVRRMTATGYDDILVVDKDDSSRLLGTISRRQIVSAYHRRMLERSPDEAPKEGVPASPEGKRETTPGMELLEAVERGDIVYGVEAHDRESTLSRIMSRAQLPEGCDRAQLLSMLREREQLGSTNIGDGIALPHPQTDNLPGLEQPRVLIAPLPHPIPWGTTDAADATPPVDTVIVLLAPSGPTYLALLGVLARSLADPALRTLLRHSAARARILQRFRALAENPEPEPR